jgi:hypothetical protein
VGGKFYPTNRLTLTVKIEKMEDCVFCKIIKGVSPADLPFFWFPKQPAFIILLILASHSRADEVGVFDGS